MDKAPSDRGGAPRQQTTDRESTMTTAQGGSISDVQNSLKSFSGGPVLLEDHMMREKIFNFDHERIADWVFHAHGYGIQDHFELTDAIPDLSCVHIFQHVYSSAWAKSGNKESFDSARDVRGSVNTQSCRRGELWTTTNVRKFRRAPMNCGRRQGDLTDKLIASGIKL